MRVTNAATNATKILKILNEKDVRIEQVHAAIAAISDIDSVEDLLDAIAPGKPAILGPKGPLFDMNRAKLRRQVTSQETYAVRVYVGMVDQETSKASVRLDALSDPRALKLLHRFEWMLAMSFQGSDLAREYLLVSQAAEVPLELKVTIDAAVLSRDAHRSTLRLQSIVGFAGGVTIDEVRERLDRLTLKRIERVLEALAKLPV